MRILIVEDEKEIAEFLKSGLESECFAADVAPDGEQGHFLACTNEYDLIILDNMLPRMCGREICAEIRKSGKRTPIIMLSVESKIEDKVELLDAGADDYMTKPFSFQELMARIRALLRRPEQLAQEIVRVGHFALDTAKGSLILGDREVKLTRKEFMILEILMRKHGEVVSRTTILEHAWDVHADPFSNTIEAHILSLRRKLSRQGGKKIIKTVIGRGYMFDAG